jgi:hypothetical protein
MRRSMLLLAILAGVSCAARAMANPAELDNWCAQAKLPSSIALCSDPGLRELAIQRNKAFEAARSRLSVDAYNALLRDQNGWVRSYSTSCGISGTQPPALPLSAETLGCLKRAGRARVEYLWNYVGSGPAPDPNPPKPADSLLPTVRNVPYRAPANRRCQDIGCLTLQLREDMTEAEVVSILGYRPGVVTLETCGQRSNRGSWDCKIYRFGTLRVLFRRTDDGEWVVNSWFAP